VTVGHTGSRSHYVRLKVYRRITTTGEQMAPSSVAALKVGPPSERADSRPKDSRDSREIRGRVESVSFLEIQMMRSQGWDSEEMVQAPLAKFSTNTHVITPQNGLNVFPLANLNLFKRSCDQILIRTWLSRMPRGLPCFGRFGQYFCGPDR
jgi:hypothetical protein